MRKADHHLNASAETVSAWSPFGYAVFRALWIATLVSNVGTWMQNVGAAWLMTSLSHSPVMVALVQAAGILPMFLLSLPAGALADIIDRRRLLLLTQVWMTVVAALLGVVTLLGVVSPWLLLSLTFLLGLGAAANGPAWQAIVPELVPRPELVKAISLNSAGFNLSRAIGPAAGGMVVAAAGVGATFVLNAVSFLGVLAVLYRWERPPTETTLPAERMVAAMFTGLRYVRHAPRLRAVLWRVGIFMVFSSSLWALLPLVARYEVGGGPASYGLLLGCFGVGAVAGAGLMPWMRRYLAGEALMAVMTLLSAVTIAVVALVPLLAALAGAMFLSGAAWLVLLSSFNVAVQTAVPSWIRARALAVYMLVFAGGLAGGSAAWGAVASHGSLRTALLLSALGLVLSLLTMIRYRVEFDEEADLTPSLHWPEPHVVIEPHPGEGPVLVTVEYFIDPDNAQDFARAMRALGAIRRRDGALRWGLFQDAANPGRFIETFIVETWMEHLRQHERITMADRDTEKRAFAFHIGEMRPQVSHLIYAYGSRGRDRRKFLRHIR
jgi:MFS family permease/quinol monooxygenase YgiN